MSRLSRQEIMAALETLSRELAEPYLVPGRQLTARYAFDDLWEARDGSGPR